MGFSRWRAGGWVVKGRMVFVVWAEGGEGALREGGRWWWVGDGGVGGQVGGWWVWCRR